MLAAKAVFYKLFTGKRMAAEQEFELEQLEKDKYLFKHGGQLAQPEIVQ